MKNLNNEEKTFLIKDKLRSGKGIKQAEEEVERDVQQIRKLNKEKIQMKKEIRNLAIEKKKAKVEFDKAFEKMIKQQSKQIKHKTISNYCMTKHLQRIINFLGEEPESSAKHISTECMIQYKQVKDGLLFLVKYKIVTKSKSSNLCTVYSVK